MQSLKKPVGLPLQVGRQVFYYSKVIETYIFIIDTKKNITTIVVKNTYKNIITLLLLI